MEKEGKEGVEEGGGEEGGEERNGGEEGGNRKRIGGVIGREEKG